MWEAILILYLFNGTLLIIHEMDSAYYKEWDLFGLPGGRPWFLLLHLPLILLILTGVLLVAARSIWGLAISLVMAGGGLTAFGLHTYFLRKGRPEFNNPTSKAILVGTLVLSLAQAAISLGLVIGSK
ncbi:MAG: DUF6713 family protein [Thermodesulfobacteriota bacterium]